MSNSITSLLVANRGEIALRVIRTAKEMGIRTIAVYAQQDRDAPYVDMADDAYLIAGDSYRDTYLNEDRVMEIVVRSGASAVHPGYGFLSESPSFARRVVETGVVWVGPSPGALERLGDKVLARRTASEAGVPISAGIDHPVRGLDELLEFGRGQGYPLVLKRMDGGGGRGICVVNDDDGLRTFFMSHDAVQGGDLSSYFAEEFIGSSRHVETQCARDSHGGFVVYSTRDCTIQRRHQKLIEEAPAPFMPEGAEEELARHSRALFEAVGYVGLGTCEFMMDEQGTIRFLEVNPRLQVEHTVSEQVCGIDLVREQVRIAAGASVTHPEGSRGHSVEFRITCEDPATNLTPSSGTLEELTWPSGPGIRVDSGVAVGDVVSPAFDSLMGKLVVTAQDRPCAIARAMRALDEMRVHGVATPISLYRRIMADPAFNGSWGRLGISTTWLEDTYLNKPPATAAAGQPASLTPGVDSDAGAERSDDESFVVEINGHRTAITIPGDVVAHVLASPITRPKARRVQPLRGGHGGPLAGPARRPEEAPGVIASPMRAVVTRIMAQVGDEVDQGDLLVVVESMKMENYIYAPCKGVVVSVKVDAGASVEPGDVLVVMDDAGCSQDGAEPSGKES
ncbi:biotin carboxylase N-terminal domain-containing protein [uncultured Bifidobacterium sp.]|uniref:ATP-binding protein n=1 Tax=uncultured Bifidobacterium sp. TaxID=165187 RepID=UPI00260D88F8|nr:biotin carboxylase N-terminal domain-containing protein [uncultured Bifidobacterium sp.]